ncbi:EF-hand domain-containing protein [Streptomyces sp. NRRL S-87]|uniref:EF-hand domain-containing protein n=1 Tax=Streptomyces sp. NRRL S-87 TaxID=1463920 RepID=UPI0004C28C41|nr:EF-hand domain-containing protein [Streptomyces sp. NRRL S-87]
MNSTMKNQKSSLLFDWFDQDLNGHLTEQDLQATAAVFAQVAPQEDLANRNAIRTAFGQWWQLLLKYADSDGDGRGSRGEFIVATADSVTAPANFQSAVMEIADAVINAADTNVDGVLSRAEYVALYRALGVPEELSGSVGVRAGRPER